MYANFAILPSDTENLFRYKYLIRREEDVDSCQNFCESTHKYERKDYLIPIMECDMCWGMCGMEYTFFQTYTYATKLEYIFQ